MIEQACLFIIAMFLHQDKLVCYISKSSVFMKEFGKGNMTDFISISFSSPDYIGHQFGPQSVEVEDCYLRLDRDIAELLEFLDAWLGKKNILLFLTADHGASETIQSLLEKNIASEKNMIVPRILPVRSRISRGLLEDRNIIHSIRISMKETKFFFYIGENDIFFSLKSSYIIYDI